MRLSLLKASASFIPQPVINQGEPDARYPRNNRGQPEFASVILTLDHLMDSDPFHVHQKAVYSTQTAREALVSLMTEYYPSVSGEKAPLLDNTTYEILKALDADPMNTIALYFVPAATRDRKGGIIVQAVLSNVALQALVAAPAFGGGSALMAMNGLVNAVADLATAGMDKFGRVPSLMLMQLQDDPKPQEHEQEDAARATG